MQIKSTSKQVYSTTPKTSGCRCPKASEPPTTDTFSPTPQSEQSTNKEWLKAAVVVGGSVGEGLLEGAGYGFLRAFGYAVGGQMGGTLATVGVLAMGAVNGTIDYGDSLTARFDNKVLGKVLAASLGAGKAGLCGGIGDPSAGISQAVLGGMAVGGTFGLIEAPGRLKG